MLIPRKGKGQLEIYKCKLGIHDWVTEHWWETRQKPRRARFSHKGGRKRAQYYLKSKPKFGNYKFKAIYQDIMNDYQEGMLVRDICNKYSIGHTTLNNYLRRLNIVRHR